MEGFFKSDTQRVDIYNRTFDILNGVKDEALRARMSETFERFKKVNREFDKLLREADDLQVKRYRKALETAISGFEARGVRRIEKDVLMATAEILEQQF
jgi:hypothetical protein